VKAEADGASFTQLMAAETGAAGAAYNDGSLGLLGGARVAGPVAAGDSQPLTLQQGQQAPLRRSISTPGMPRQGGAYSKAGLCTGVSLVKLLLAYLLGASLMYQCRRSGQLLHGMVSDA
jgi:hypothetical protein